MKKISLTFILLGTLSSTVLIAQPSTPSKPTTKPIVKPSYDRLSRDDYAYNPYYNDAELAEEKALKKKQEKEKEKRIALEKERNATRKLEQQALQKKNKAEFDKEMKKFDNRQSSSPTKNSIIISDKPIQ